MGVSEVPPPFPMFDNSIGKHSVQHTVIGRAMIYNSWEVTEWNQQRKTTCNTIWGNEAQLSESFPHGTVNNMPNFPTEDLTCNGNQNAGSTSITQSFTAMVSETGFTRMYKNPRLPEGVTLSIHHMAHQNGLALGGNFNQRCRNASTMRIHRYQSRAKLVNRT